MERDDQQLKVHYTAMYCVLSSFAVCQLSKVTFGLKGDYMSVSRLEYGFGLSCEKKFHARYRYDPPHYILNFFAARCRGSGRPGKGVS